MSLQIAKTKFQEGLESSPDYFRRFFNHMDLSGKALTGEQYTRIVRQFLDAVDRSPDLVKLIDIEDWLSDMKKDASERTVNKYSFALKKFFEWYGAAYNLERDLAKLIPTSTSYTITKAPTWLEPEKVYRIIHTASSISPLARAAIHVSYDLALRINECCMLQRSWYDPNHKTMQVLRLKRKDKFMKELPMPQDAVDSLEAYLKTRKDRHEALFVVKGGRLGREYRAIDWRTLEIYFKKACELAGVTIEVSKGIYKIPSFHILRHSSLTKMAIDMIESEGKADEVRIAEFAGHKNVSTPLIYIHLGSQYLTKK